MGGPRRRAHAPADPGRPGRAEVRGLPRPLPDPGGVRGGAGRRRGHRLGRPRLQPPGREPAPLRDGGHRRARRRDCPTTSPACWPCPASARTPPGPCWPSPTSATSACSTPTRRGCWPASAGRPLGRAEAQAAADAVGPGGRGVGVEPGRARPRRDGVHALARPGAPSCPVTAWCAWSLAGCPAPDPAVGSAGVSTPQSPVRGLGPPGPRPPGRRPAGRRRGATSRAGRRCMGWPDDPARARTAADSLVADGIAGVAAATRWSGPDRRPIDASSARDEVDDEPVDDGGLLVLQEVPGADDQLGLGPLGQRVAAPARPPSRGRSRPRRRAGTASAGCGA